MKLKAEDIVQLIHHVVFVKDGTLLGAANAIIQAVDAAEKIYTPFLNCGWKNAADGCCSHPQNTTPECTKFCCPITVAKQVTHD